MNKLVWNDEWQIIARTRAYGGEDITAFVKQLVETVNLLDTEYPKLLQRLKEAESRNDKLRETNTQLIGALDNAVSKEELNAMFRELNKTLE